MLAALGEQIDALLDVTVVYDDGLAPGFWALLSGQVARVRVDIRIRDLEPALWQGDYENDPVFRQYMHDWVAQLWRDKDARIQALL